MRNTALIFVAILVIGGATLYILTTKQKEVVNNTPAVTSTDPKNATYSIEGLPVTLVDGNADTTSSDGVSTNTRYFGNELSIDLNADGRMDEVFLVTQETGGSGTFFYLLGALASETGYVGTEGVFIGDRIAPQTTEQGENNTVIVNYADRAKGEPFTTAPSQGKSLVLKFDTQTKQFGEVVQDFEGEADTSVMSLQMKTWEWISAELKDGSTVTPNNPGKFTLTFTTDGSFSATTDCNAVGGTFVSDEQTISFSDMMSTLMYCEGSQESTFTQLLTDTTSYNFTNRGELVLNLTSGNGSVTFR
jgi:heat shock protein HslJ